MAKYLNDVVLDAALEYVKFNASRIVLVSGQPSDYHDAVTNSPGGVLLGAGLVDDTQFTVQNGLTSGRRVTVALQAGVTISASGTATHVALVDDLNQELLYVTTVASTAVSSGLTAEIDSFDLELRDVA